MKSNFDDLSKRNRDAFNQYHVADLQQTQLLNTAIRDNELAAEAIHDAEISMDQLTNAIAEAQSINDQFQSLANKTGNIDEFLDQTRSEFESKTKLTKKDMVFLLLAVTAQVFRQYVLTGNNNWDKDSRPNDKQAAKEANHADKYDRSTRNSGYYYTTATEILHNPVPFDTAAGSPDFDAKLHGGYHRNYTIGHDPIFGWIFGTANIATRTVTLWTMQSYHVRYAPVGAKIVDRFSAHASTMKVLKYGLVDNALHLNNGILAASLFEEFRHLNSDIKSKDSLPIPGSGAVTSLINEAGKRLGDDKLANYDLQKQLSQYGIDMNNVAAVGKQATYVLAINKVIAMLHRFFYDSSVDGPENLYKVRTTKILAYSNTIASVSNVIYVAIKSIIEKKPDIKDLDIGGILVTIATVVWSKNTQAEIYAEFLSNKWEDYILED